MLTQSEKNRVFRILDANRNRAVEGLRAIEEFFRFSLSDISMTERLKTFRHQICTVCSPDADQWLLLRDVTDDVGTEVTTSGEYQRSDLAAVVAANCSRVSESLRSLEEYLKTVNPAKGKAIESLRYEYYELEKQIKSRCRVEQCLQDKLLYVLTSGCDSTGQFEQRMNLLVQSGASIIQLREKNLPDGELLERAKLAASICRKSDSLFIVNDRPDIALMAGADGVHLGQEEFPIADVRLMLPPQMLIGISTHSLEQAKSAVENGADYIGVGPTFPSKTKCFSEFKGTELLTQVSTAVDIPAFAIGGITQDNLEKVTDAGFFRVAVSNAIHSADSPQNAVQYFLKRLGSAKACRQSVIQ